MSVTISIQGLADFKKITDSGRLKQALAAAVDRAAEAMRDEVKKLPPVSKARTGFSAHGIPVDTGRMRQSIQKRRRLALLAAEVYTGVHYGGYVHDGTGRMPPRPFFRWLIDDFHGQDRINELVRHALEQFTRP